MRRRHGTGAYRRDLARLALVAGAISAAPSAQAGGFDLPDLGTQAIGRGAAFVAKADDATALYYNPAGLARQRGTRALVDASIFASSFSFARIGTYPGDPQDAQTQYANSPFPLVQNTGGPYFVPFLGVTSDFETFDRLTFAVGLFSPPSIMNRTFALGSGDNPSPARYDFVQNRSRILIPTASVGVRALDWLDLGLSLHLARGSFATTTVNYADGTSCKSIEDFRCDAQTEMAAAGFGVGATLGVMARPSEKVGLGLSIRTPITFNAAGAVDVAKPIALAAGQETQPGTATYGTQLPWLVKAGGRYIGMAGTFEQYDLELDAVFETWGSAQGGGPVITAPDLGSLKNVQIVDQHGYSSTYGVRAGGAYNFEIGENIFTLRGGAYFDSAATSFQTTRVDWDTLSKFAGTLGAGFKVGAFQFDLGYAAVASAPRLVGSGAGLYSPPNLQQGGQPTGDKDIVNEGAYRGFTHVISLGIEVAIDRFLGPPRKTHFGNPWEPSYAGEKKADDGEQEPKHDDLAIPPEEPIDKPAEAAKPVETAPPPPKPVETPKLAVVESAPPATPRPVEAEKPVEVVPSTPEPEIRKRPPEPDPPPPPKKEVPKKEPPPRKEPKKRPPPEPDPEPEPEPEPPPAPKKKPAPPPPEDEKPIIIKKPAPAPEKPAKKRKEWWEEG